MLNEKEFWETVCVLDVIPANFNVLSKSFTVSNQVTFSLAANLLLSYPRLIPHPLSLESAIYSASSSSTSK